MRNVKLDLKNILGGQRIINRRATENPNQQQQQQKKSNLRRGSNTMHKNKHVRFDISKSKSKKSSPPSSNNATPPIDQNTSPKSPPILEVNKTSTPKVYGPARYPLTPLRGNRSVPNLIPINLNEKKMNREKIINRANRILHRPSNGNVAKGTTNAILFNRVGGTPL